MARYTDETVAEIKSRIRLSDLIGKTVTLKKKGKDHVGLSPFSNEKTASFYVHDDRGFYKCFSTQKSGDCITWQMEHGRMSFAEAIESLAEMAGVELKQASPQETDAARKRSRILQCLDWAQDYFARALFWSDSDDGKAARRYITGRNLYGTNAEIQDAGVGWAPSTSHQMQKQALADGFTIDELMGAGLLRMSDNNQPRAFFRDRITLPVRDLQGRVIGFTARALKDAQQPKYLNSPETAVFSKGASLFGLQAARELVQRGACLHIVEGCFDAERMRLHKLAACAPLGTAITVQQLELAWRVVESPILTFDGDAAGLRASRIAAERALQVLRGGRSLRFILLPQGHDPDTLLRDGKHLPEPVSHFEVVWGALSDGLKLTDPSDRMTFRNRAQQMLGYIADEPTRKEWRAALRARFSPVETPPQAAAQPKAKREARTREAKAQAGTRLEEPEATAAVLLMSLLDDPVRADAHVETLAGLPCGRFSPLRDYLVADGAEQSGLLLPWAMELQRDLRASGIAATRYSPEGWERAARALVARYPPQ